MTIIKDFQGDVNPDTIDLDEEETSWKIRAARRSNSRTEGEKVQSERSSSSTKS